MKIKSHSDGDGISIVDSEEWAGYYESKGQRVEYREIDIEDFRNLPFKITFEKVQSYFTGGAMLEVGAGDSDRLVDFCRRLKPSECYGLDFVELGCERLRRKAVQAGISLEVICADMFSPPKELKEKFDFVMSFGVVEHFHDLAAVVRVIGSFAKKSGIVFTLIPNNKRTIYGWLMRRWNREVYDAHIMYDATDLEIAHSNAGMEVLWNGYVVSSNFGMLSWCFKGRKSGLKFWVYKQLTRVSKALWYFESKAGLLRPSRFFAPYIICVSRVVA